MRRPALALAAMLGVAAAQAAPPPLAPPRAATPPRATLTPRAPRRVFVPAFRPPRPHLRPPPLLLPSPPPDTFIEPLPPEPAPPEAGSPGLAPPLPHGFSLTVPVGAGARFAVPATLGRTVDVGQALGACFTPPPGVAWRSMTLRVSFRRDGSVFGLPRVPFSDAASPEQKTELARSSLDALKRCAPLPLSASLGGAIAGEIFAIRFLNQDRP